MQIMFADDRVIVCLKPFGVLSTDEPGGMPSLLRAALGDSEAVVKNVHRLDRAVGGVMVYARTKRAASDLGLQIRTGVFDKEYLAIVHGAPSEDHGEWEDWLLRDRARRKTEVVPPNTPEARRAKLSWKLLRLQGDMSLLSIRLHTGRTHQIRSQLSARGLPIVGDRKYGSADGTENVALWSHKIAFMHPRDKSKLVFTHDAPNTYPWDMFS